MIGIEEFENIRPYQDHEVHPALLRIIASPHFDAILDFLFHDKDKSEIKARLSTIHNSGDFQKEFMYPLVTEILNKSSFGLTTSGFDALDKGKAYLFIANHRDIVLDAAFLQLKLTDYGHNTSEITFGSNLMTSRFIIDLGKVNKMFVVSRGGNGRELFKNSRLLSGYIRYTITSKNTSVWIAQRNGRTKDGIDKTEPGIIKMFNISGKSDFIESIRELNIVPLTVSYEYEPCISFKIRENIAKMTAGMYVKNAGEDLENIISGITGQKGRIHIAAGRPVNWFLAGINHLRSNNDKTIKLAELIDSEMTRNYRIWPSSYIAYDMLQGEHNYSAFYSQDEKEAFLKHMHEALSVIEYDTVLKRDLLLKIYANPFLQARHL